MINLVFNELIKIFNKRSIYIVLFLILIFIFFTNFLYKYKLDENGQYKNSDVEYNYLEIAKNNMENNEDYYLNKYIVDNKVNINKMNDSRGILINFFNEYELLIIVFLVIVLGGIISDEFNKGTIKQLLITPSSRIKVIISKYMTSLIIFIFIFLFILIIQLIISGIFFGYSSFKIPVVLYNSNTNNIVIIPVFKYLFKILLCKLPMIIFTISLLILIGIIIDNTLVTSITVLINYIILTPIFINVVVNNSNSILKYIININWDLSPYLYGKTYLNLNMNFSLLVSIIYICLNLFISFILFDNKDVKNI